ncbi:hypothetical protein AG1IA_03018 [Rhizoctonia solani AG-1 IA]|uniref:Uncharacterized protein n=1 Tax=Thanatephorus cucumeris (strain AG1-IA) TaxID=983506 RepID=L8X1I2_THACA|nr:hypothetical protein AG1IA_03018 [Rhizoctonia solani AG-1 IA]
MEYDAAPCRVAGEKLYSHEDHPQNLGTRYMYIPVAHQNESNVVRVFKKLGITLLKVPPELTILNIFEYVVWFAFSPKVFPVLIDSFQDSRTFEY